METHAEVEERNVNRGGSGRTTPYARATPHARASANGRRNSIVELEEKIEEDEMEEENMCDHCGMAFETAALLETHEDEIHDQRKNKFSGVGFMIVAWKFCVMFFLQ